MRYHTEKGSAYMTPMPMMTIRARSQQPIGPKRPPPKTCLPTKVASMSIHKSHLNALTFNENFHVAHLYQCKFRTNKCFTASPSTDP